MTDNPKGSGQKPGPFLFVIVFQDKLYAADWKSGGLCAVSQTYAKKMEVCYNYVNCYKSRFLSKLEDWERGYFV